MSSLNAGLTILVVEDEWLLRHSIVDFLKRAGCEVLEAGSGEDAVVLLEQNVGIDAVITDLRLGGTVNGWDVAEVARAFDPARPIVYTSGDLIDPERPVPGSLFIQKPYDLEEVLAGCKNLCSS
jgi:DNA-binding response OmpR family regulator